MKRILLLVAVVAACTTSPTAPKGHDPTALIRNGSADPVLWWWFDGHTTSGFDSIPAGVTRCERFLAQADSARFDLADSVRIKAHGTGWYEYSSNYFDPTARPTWVINIDATTNLVADTSAVPC